MSKMKEELNMEPHPYRSGILKSVAEAKAESKEIAPQQPATKEITPQSPTVPAGRGFESGIDHEDLLIPRAMLLQPLSPAVQDDGMKAGTIINSITKEELPAAMIPIFHFKNWIRFNTRSKTEAGYNPNYEPGAIIWRSSDPLDPRVQKEGRFDENGNKPLAVTFFNFFSFFPGVPMPIVVSFAKTSYKAGKHLLSLARFGGGDMWSRYYELKSVQEKNDKGAYYVFKVSPAGAQTEPNTLATCERYWKEFSSRTRDILVHDQEEVAESKPEGDTSFDV